MTREDVDAIERAICPGEGACGGMYTANTMASAAEAMGMSLPGSAAPPAVDRRRDGFARRTGEAVVELLRQGITARDIMTKRGLRERHRRRHGARRLHQRRAAPAGDRPRGRRRPRPSTTSTAIGAKVPHLADVKPFGRYVMNDVDRIGGVPVVMKALLDAGLLHGDCLTVTGKTMAENLRRHRPAGPRRRGAARARRADPRRPAASPSCTARWPPRAPW